MDDDIYKIEMNIETVRIVYKALSISAEKWPGGNPQEQVDIIGVRDYFYRMILEYQFENLQ